ncbi:MAG: hypothetical protein KC431_23145 [Myxococcales bacterium]|nr:hypothetical protein [Myxococcales bacterium]
MHLRLHPMIGRGLVAGAIALACTLAPTRVFAAPIEASASAPADAAGSEGARGQALAQARRAALEQAIATIDIPVDDTAVAAVLARFEAWTAGYRVLAVEDLGAELRVTIEAEIDLPRLRKRLAVPGTGTRSTGFVWTAPKQQGCDTVDAQAIQAMRTSLEAYGIVVAGKSADSGSTLSLSLRCKDQGAVTHTHVRAAAVEIVAETSGAVTLKLEVAAQGFAEELDAATAIALDRALGDLADALAIEARGELELRVEQPWPAARIRVLEDSLRATVIGVDKAELAGIGSDGTAVLRITGSVDGKALGQQLQASSFPGFRLVGLRIDTAHALRVRMQ